MSVGEICGLSEAEKQWIYGNWQREQALKEHYEQADDELRTLVFMRGSSVNKRFCNNLRAELESKDGEAALHPKLLKQLISYENQPEGTTHRLSRVQNQNGLKNFATLVWTFAITARIVYLPKVPILTVIPAVLPVWMLNRYFRAPIEVLEALERNPANQQFAHDMVDFNNGKVRE